MPLEQIRRIPRCKRYNLTEDKHSNLKLIDGDGWQQYVKDEINNITAFLGKWIVPAKPSNFAAGVLFTFTGLQNIDWVPPNPDPTGPFDIIQPVLQYGESDAGGGLYWSMASWYVTLNTDVVFSTLKQVDSGVVIFGNMTKLDSDTWFIDTVDTSTNDHTSITVSRSILVTQPWAYVTLEVYDIFSCDNYPTGSIPYTDLQIFALDKLITPQWEIGKAGQNPPICDSSIVVKDAATVSIAF